MVASAPPETGSEDREDQRVDPPLTDPVLTDPVLAAGPPSYTALLLADNGSTRHASGPTPGVGPDSRSWMGGGGADVDVRGDSGSVGSDRPHRPGLGGRPDSTATGEYLGSPGPHRQHGSPGRYWNHGGAGRSADSPAASGQSPGAGRPWNSGSAEGGEEQRHREHLTARGRDGRGHADQDLTPQWRPVSAHSEHSGPASAHGEYARPASPCEDSDSGDLRDAYRDRPLLDGYVDSTGAGRGSPRHHGHDAYLDSPVYGGGSPRHHGHGAYLDSPVYGGGSPRQGDHPARPGHGGDSPRTGDEAYRQDLRREEGGGEGSEVSPPPTGGGLLPAAPPTYAEAMANMAPTTSSTPPPPPPLLPSAPSPNSS